MAQKYPLMRCVVEGGNFFWPSAQYFFVAIQSPVYNLNLRRTNTVLKRRETHFGQSTSAHIYSLTSYFFMIMFEVMVIVK